MKKIIKGFLIILIISLLILVSNISYARFVDIKYPPNSSGYTDLTDEEADKQAEEKAENQADEGKTSQDYVGKSSNNNLKNLEVENAIIEPEFNSSIFDYTINLNDQSAKTIKINAEAEDEKATIQGIGEIQLTDGINKLQVIVTAENGNIKIYNLIVNLPYNQSDLRLNALEILGIHVNGGEDSQENLTPDFNKDIYEYTLTVPNEINGLNVKTEANAGILVSVTGQDPLKVGKNIVVIELTDNNDSSKKTSYVIQVERQEQKDDNFIIWGIGIAIVIIIVVIFIILMKKRKRK